MFLSIIDREGRADIEPMRGEDYRLWPIRRLLLNVSNIRRERGIRRSGLMMRYLGWEISRKIFWDTERGSTCWENAGFQDIWSIIIITYFPKNSNLILFFEDRQNSCYMTIICAFLSQRSRCHWKDANLCIFRDQGWMQLPPGLELIVWNCLNESRLSPGPGRQAADSVTRASGENQFVEIEFKQ